MSTAGETPIDPSWTLPKLRVDVDGNWYDDDVEITHHGVLANLRGNLRRDKRHMRIQPWREDLSASLTVVSARLLWHRKNDEGVFGE